MKRDYLRQSTLYKYRYIVGLTILSLCSVLFAGYKFWSLPGGLSSIEIESALISGSYSPFDLVTNFANNLDVIVNLPWNLLQWISLNIFGLSIFSIRFPAVIFMILSSIGIAMILKRWFRPNIAMIGGFLTITSVMFLGLSRSGSTASLNILLIVVTLFSVTNIIAQKNSSFVDLIYKVAVIACLSLLIYTPGGLYVVLGLAIAGLIHPKVRLLLIRVRPWKIACGVLVGLIVLTPLIISLTIQAMSGSSQILMSLLVSGGQLSIENSSLMLSSLFGLESSFVGGIVVPMITMVGLIILVIGKMNVMLSIASARSYLIISLLTPALALSFWQPDLIYLLFVPSALLISVGLQTIINRWYSLFPRNPYARISAMIPLALLVISLSWTSIYQFINAENYNSKITYNYNYEFPAVFNELHKNNKDSKQTTLVVDDSQLEFYKLLEKDFVGLDVSTKPNFDGDSTIVLTSSGVEPKDKSIESIITDWHAENSDLLRVYSNK